MNNWSLIFHVFGLVCAENYSRRKFMNDKVHVETPQREKCIQESKGKEKDQKRRLTSKELICVW